MLKMAIIEQPPDVPLPPRFDIGNMATFITDSNTDMLDDALDMECTCHARILHAMVSAGQEEQEQMTPMQIFLTITTLLILKNRLFLKNSSLRGEGIVLV
jgi:hypothetical protein